MQRDNVLDLMIIFIEIVVIYAKLTWFFSFFGEITYGYLLKIVRFWKTRSRDLDLINSDWTKTINLITIYHYETKVNMRIIKPGYICSQESRHIIYVLSGFHWRAKYCRSMGCSGRSRDGLDDQGNPKQGLKTIEVTFGLTIQRRL